MSEGIGQIGLQLSLLGLTLVIAGVGMTLNRIAAALEERNSNGNQPK